MRTVIAQTVLVAIVFVVPTATPSVVPVAVRKSKT